MGPRTSGRAPRQGPPGGGRPRYHRRERSHAEPEAQSLSEITPPGDPLRDAEPEQPAESAPESAIEPTVEAATSLGAGEGPAPPAGDEEPMPQDASDESAPTPAGAPPPPPGDTSPPFGGAPAPPPPGDGEPPRPLGVVDQLKRAIAAGRRLVDAHVALAKAELSSILADAKQVAVELGIVVALLLFVAVLVSVGTTLFMGEWLFGSIGWGVLHGTEVSIGVAVALVLLALEIPGSFIVRMLIVAILVGLVVAVLFVLDATHYAWQSLGDAILPGVEPGIRPLVTAVVVTGITFAVVGAVAGARSGAPGHRLGASFSGLFVGLLAGAALGAFTAIAYSPQVGIAIGVAVTLAIWPAISVLPLRNYDWEALQARFTPTATIETTQETLEWLQRIQERTLPGKRS